MPLIGNRACGEFDRFSGKALRLALLAGAGGLSIATAHAQAAASPGAAQEGLSDRGGLEDIVVTARRVEERLQDVPLSISAFSTEALDKQQIRSVNDLASTVPNMKILPTASAGGSQIYVRGLVNSGLPNITLDTRVGIYLDGVYIARTQGFSFTLADIKRLEVLRGPQGTAFGKNVTAGVINFVTQAPSGEFGGKLEAGFGNFGRQRYRATIETPEFGGLSARFTAVHDEIKGDISNVLASRQYAPFVGTGNSTRFDVRPSATRFGGYNSEAYFAAVRYTGIADLTLDYKFDYTDQAQYPRPYQILGYPGSFVGCASASLALGLAISCPANNSRQINTPFPVTVGSATVAPRSFNKLTRIADDYTGPATTRVQGHSITAQIVASDSMAIKSITGFRKMRTFSHNNLDGGDYFASNDAFNILGTFPGATPLNLPAGQLSSYCIECSSSKQRQHQFSQELQITGNLGDTFEYVAGAYYFRESGKIDNFFTANIAPIGIVFGSGVAPLKLIGQGTNFLNGSAFDNGDDAATRSISRALFGRVTAHLGDSIDIVVGGRYTQDRKRSRISAQAAGRIDLDPLTPGIQGPPTVVRAAFNKFTYDGTITYKVNPDVNFYARYATAYLAGGFLRNVAFLPETTKAVELGVKSELFDRRLRFNAAVFNQKSKDAQQSTNSLPFGALVVTNLGSLRTRGLEVEATAIPVDGLTLGGSLGYVSQRVVPAQRRNAPRITAQLNAEYVTPPLFNDSRLEFRIDASYQSSSYALRTRLQDAPQNDGTPLPAAIIAGYPDQLAYLTALDKAVRQGEYWLTNARITLTDVDFAGTKGRVSGYVRNLFNVRGLIEGQNVGVIVGGRFEGDRTFGVDFTVDF
jgi:iron complex outermembrane receptor protein